MDELDEKRVEEIEIAESADPMAKARAAKARKAAEKEEAKVHAAELSRASHAQGQPVVSKIKGKAHSPYQGEQVMVTVTSWGNGHISSGGQDGLERFAGGAVIPMPEFSARSLWNKRWVEPVDQTFVTKWTEMNRRELRAAMNAKRRTDFYMEHGTTPNEDWRSAMTPGELSFTPREEDLAAYGLAQS